MRMQSEWKTIYVANLNNYMLIRQIIDMRSRLIVFCARYKTRLDYLFLSQPSPDH